MAFEQPLQQSIPFDTLLGLLSVFCGETDIVELIDYFCSHTHHQVLTDFSERRRNSRSLSSSQRSSLVSIFSFVSSSSIGSLDSTTQTTSTAYPEILGHITRNPDQFHHESFTPFANPTTSPYPSPFKQESPHPTIPTPGAYNEIDPALHVCITCRKRYDTKHKLSRHRTDKCEIKGFWVCPYCPPDKRLEFERTERLQSHFEKYHRRAGGSECNASCQMPCSTHQPELDVQASFRPHPTKKAWGCPVCETCFDNFEEWEGHEKIHYPDVVSRDKRATDIMVNGWSECQQVKSLLFRSKDLQTATARYNWDLCQWPLDEEAWRSLTFALERYTFPSDLRSHHLYASLNIADALALYAFRMGISGKPHSPRDIAPHYLKPAGSLDISTYPTSETPIITASKQMGANSLHRGQTIDYSALQLYEIQGHVPAMNGPFPYALPIQSFDPVPNMGRSTQSDRQRPALQGSSPEPQRPKSRGFLRDVFSRGRSKSNSHRNQEAAPVQSVPALPSTLSIQRPQEMVWHELVRRPYDTEVEPVTRGDQANVHEANHNINISAAKNIQNGGEQSDEKRFSTMSWIPTTDAESQHPDPNSPDLAYHHTTTQGLEILPDGGHEGYDISAFL